MPCETTQGIAAFGKLTFDAWALPAEVSCQRRPGTHAVGHEQTLAPVATTDLSVPQGVDTRAFNSELLASGRLERRVLQCAGTSGGNRWTEGFGPERYGLLSAELPTGCLRPPDARPARALNSPKQIAVPQRAD